MKKFWKYIKNNALTIATVIIFIYPILPLAGFAFLATIMGFSDVFFGRHGLFGGNFKIEPLLFYLLSVSGVAGFVGAILVIINLRTKLSLALISIGLVSYVFALVALVSLNKLSFETILITSYLLFTVIVVLIHIIQIAKDLYHQRLPFVVIDLNASPETIEGKNSGRKI